MIYKVNWKYVYICAYNGSHLIYKFNERQIHVDSFRFTSEVTLQGYLKLISAGLVSDTLHYTFTYLTLRQRNLFEPQSPPSDSASPLLKARKIRIRRKKKKKTKATNNNGTGRFFPPFLLGRQLLLWMKSRSCGCGRSRCEKKRQTRRESFQTQSLIDRTD